MLSERVLLDAAIAAASSLQDKPERSNCIVIITVIEPNGHNLGSSSCGIHKEINDPQLT